MRDATYRKYRGKLPSGPVNRAFRRAHPSTVSDFMLTVEEAGLLGSEGNARPGWTYRTERRREAKLTYRRHA